MEYESRKRGSVMKSNKTAGALSYPSDVEAPFILTKAKGYLAESLIQIAMQNNIPVKEDEVLANVLSLYDAGNYIPEATYEAIAKIFSFIKQNEQKQEE